MAGTRDKDFGQKWNPDYFDYMMGDCEIEEKETIDMVYEWLDSHGLQHETHEWYMSMGLYATGGKLIKVSKKQGNFMSKKVCEIRFWNDDCKIRSTETKGQVII